MVESPQPLRRLLGLSRRKCALLMAVGHFPAMGGEAYGKKARDAIPALPDMLHHCPYDDDLHISKGYLSCKKLVDRPAVPRAVNINLTV